MPSTNLSPSPLHFSLSTFFPPLSFLSAMTKTWNMSYGLGMGLRAEGRLVCGSRELLPSVSRVEENTKTFTEINSRSHFCVMELYGTLMTMRVLSSEQCAFSHIYNTVHTISGNFQLPWNPYGDIISPSVDRTTWEAAKSYQELCFEIIELKHLYKVNVQGH